MAEPRLPTALWLGAHLRTLSTRAVPAAVLRRGDPTGGLVILRINMLADGTRVLSQTRDSDGKLAWLAAFAGKQLSEAEADAYVDRAVKRDPDLWVVEIEDRAGLNPFEGKTLT